MIVVERPVRGRHRPSHIARLPQGAQQMWTVRVQPVKRRRRSRRVLMQLTVAELVEGSRPRELPRPWWRAAGRWALDYAIRVFESEPAR